jgi:hypothetical protein
MTEPNPRTLSQPYPMTDLPSGNDVVFRLRYDSRTHWSEQTTEEIKAGISRALAFEARLDQELAGLNERMAEAFPEFVTEIATLPPWSILDRSAIDPATGLPRSHARYGRTDYVLVTEGDGKADVEIEGRTYRIEVEPFLILAALFANKPLSVSATAVE